MIDFSGELTLEIAVQTPGVVQDPTTGRVSVNLQAWMALVPFLRRTTMAELSLVLEDPNRLPAFFDERIAPDLVAQLVDSLRVELGSPRGQDLCLDPTLITPWRRGEPVRVGLRARLAPSSQETGAGVTPTAIRRASVGWARINVGFGRSLFMNGILKAWVRSGALRYATACSSGALFSSANLNDDLSPLDAVTVRTPLAPAELRRPRDEDAERAERLRQHLNGENLEYYHQLLWTEGMSPERRYMLLDSVHLSHPRYDAIYAARGVLGRSIASLVENRVVGVAGNCIILPVSPGYNLDPSFEIAVPDASNPTASTAAGLFEHYASLAERGGGEGLKFRLSVPTAGVFGEAVQGACNACEKIDDTRFWDWEVAKTDEPTAIGPVSTDSRYQAPQSATPTALPPAIVAFQNAPAAPDPQGLGGALALLGKGDAFRDATGLAGTQQAAVTAMTSAQAAALEYARLAKDVEAQRNAQKNGARMHQDVDTYFPRGTPENTEYHRRITEAQLGVEPTERRAATLLEAARAAAAEGSAVRVRDGGREVEVQPAAEGASDRAAGAAASAGGGGGGPPPRYDRYDGSQALVINEAARGWLQQVDANFDVWSSFGGEHLREDVPPLPLGRVTSTMLLYVVAADSALESSLLHDVLASFDELPEGVGAVAIVSVPGVDCFVMEKVPGDATTLPMTVLEKWTGPTAAHPRTLQLFLHRALRAIEDASRVVLMVGSHGAGVGELGVLTNGEDHTTLPEFGRILRAALASGRRSRFDLVMLDSCLNGMLEVAAELHGIADTLLASEAPVMGCGHDFQTVFQRFTPYDWMDLRESFVQHFGDDAVYASFVALDLGRPLKRLLDLLAGLVSAFPSLPEPAQSALVTAMTQANVVPDSTPEMFNAVDLPDLLDRLVTVAPDPTTAALIGGVQAALADVLLRVELRTEYAQHVSVAGLRGISIYLPARRSRRQQRIYAATAFERRIGWLALQYRLRFPEP